MKIKSLAGHRYGLLKVEQDLPGYFCLCTCTCGNKVQVNRYSLLTHRTRSCGCLRSGNPGPRRRKVPQDLMQIDWRKSNSELSRVYKTSRNLFSIYRNRLEREGRIKRIEAYHKWPGDRRKAQA